MAIESLLLLRGISFAGGMFEKNKIERKHAFADSEKKLGTV
jgi:hypothetical protein